MASLIHWYYPSTIVGCGLNIDDLSGEQLSCVRGEVTCPTCRWRLATDRLICAGCRGETTSHICNPDTVTDQLGAWLRGDPQRRLLLEFQPLGPHVPPQTRVALDMAGALGCAPDIEEQLRIALGGQFIARMIESGNFWRLPQTSTNISALIAKALDNARSKS